MFYMARDGDNFMKMQLHRVGSRRQGRRAADRSEVQPHRRRLPAEAAGGGAAAAPAGGRAALRHLAGQQVTSSTSTRRTTSRRRRRLVDMTGKVVAQVAKSDMTKFDAARPEEGRDVHVSGGRRQDDALRDDSVSRRTSIRRRSIRRWRRCTAGRGRQQRADRELRGAHRRRRSTAS